MSSADVTMAVHRAELVKNDVLFNTPVSKPLAPPNHQGSTGPPATHRVALMASAGMGARLVSPPSSAIPPR